MLISENLTMYIEDIRCDECGGICIECLELVDDCTCVEEEEEEEEEEEAEAAQEEEAQCDCVFCRAARGET